MAMTINPKGEKVNHPQHYGGENNPFETIKVLEGTFSVEEFRGFCLGNAIKYISRCMRKNGLEDLKKARWYIDRLITFLESK